MCCECHGNKPRKRETVNVPASKPIGLFMELQAVRVLFAMPAWQPRPQAWRAGAPKELQAYQ